MKFLPLLSLLFLTACTSVHIEQTETDEHGVIRRTDIRARTVWDARNELTKLRTTMTDKSQGVGLAGMNQESSASNVVTIILSIPGAAASAGAAVVRP